MTKAQHKIDTALGEVIRRRRTELGLSQEELSYRTGVDRSYVSEIESGLKRASLRTVFKLAEGLELPPSELVARVEAALNEQAD